MLTGWNKQIDYLVLGLAWLAFFQVKIMLTYVLIFAVFVGAIWFLKKDLKTAIFYGLLLALPFERGVRGFMFEVVPAGPEIWLKGYEVYFGITVKLILSFSLFLLMLNENKWQIKKSNLKTNWLMVGLVGIGLVSSFVAIQPILAMMVWWQLLMMVFVMLISQHFFRKKEHCKFFIKYLISMLIFLGLIGSWQFISQQPIGLFLEDRLLARPFGWLTNESRLIYRVSGLVGHPTFFGSFLSLLFPLAISGLIWGKEKLIYSLAGLLGFVAIFGTYSRSAWIVAIISLTVLSWRWLRLKNKGKIDRIIKVMGLSLLGFLGIFSSVFRARLGSFKYIWSLGSGRGRLVLIKEAFKMIKVFPVFGVGLNHFVRVMRENSLDPEVLGLLYPVHNTFLLFICEIGLLAGGLFILFILMVLLKSFKKSWQSWQGIGVYLGVISFVINAQFHTLFNSDPSFYLMMVMTSFLLSI